MWYVIWSLTGKEDELIERIKAVVPDKLYSRAWTPLKIKITRKSGEESTAPIKMFPGYVFIDTDVPEAIHALLQKEKSYITLLKSDDVYLPVSEAEKEIINFLHQRRGHCWKIIGYYQGRQYKHIRRAS